ncbi:MAG: DUF4349 domain-containing protein [Halobacteria archaeon]|nr:DUF4349 domain-containing protein [Halobacteria archaeon]
MTPKDIRSWLSEHRIAAVSVLVSVILVVALVLGAVSTVLFGFGFGMTGGSSSQQTGFGGAPETVGVGEDTGAGSGAGEYVEVQEAEMSIESESLDEDVSRLRDLTQESGGYVEESSRRQSNLYLTARMTARVPSENFEEFVKSTRDEFDVESYEVRSYRLSIERETTELDILNQTLREYEATRSEIAEMNASAEKLDLLMEVTEKELEVKEKMSRYRTELAQKRQRSEYATVRIEVRERRQPEIVPDNIGDRFRNEVRQMIETVVNILITTVTGGVVVFFRAIQYLIYLVVVAVPVFVAYKLGRWMYGRLSERG